MLSLPVPDRLVTGFEREKEGLCPTETSPAALLAPGGPAEGPEPRTPLPAQIREDKLPETVGVSKAEQYLEQAEQEGRRNCLSHLCHS